MNIYTSSVFVAPFSVLPILLLWRLLNRSTLKTWACCVSLALSMGLVNGCSNDANVKTDTVVKPDNSSAIHESSNFDDAYRNLSTEDKRILDRYKKRIENSEAHKKGAVEAVTVEEALRQQLQFERLQKESELNRSDNDYSTPSNRLDPVNKVGSKNATRKQDQISSVQFSQQFPISIQPLAQPQSLEHDTDYDTVSLNLQLTNLSQKPLSTFKGTLGVTSGGSYKPKSVVIPITVFDPAIDIQSTAVLTAPIPITTEEDMNQWREPKNLHIHLNKGTLTFADGSSVQVLEE